MTFGRGRPRRPDDWPSGHVRARAALAERLDGPLDPDDALWLEEHLAACTDCTAVAAEYAGQRAELRSLREHPPQPPRDLWARTAAAIEAESRFRDARRRSGGRRRSSFAPLALLTAAVAVAVAVGTLTSSQRPLGDGATARPTQDVALATDAAGGGSGSPSVPRATPIVVAQKVEWLSRDATGKYRVETANVDEVCPPDATEPCDTAAPDQALDVPVQQEVSSVWGSPDSDALIVVNRPGAEEAATVSVVTLRERPASPSPSPQPTATPTPTATASVVPPATPTPTPRASASPSVQPSSAPPIATPSPVSPSATPSATPSASAGSPSPSVAVSPTPAGESVEIARDVIVVGQSAAYSPSGTWFAFTARPADGSAGPDIYVWKVGDELAVPVTTDHRSAFGSWSGDQIVGSTVTETAKGGENGQAAEAELSATAFLLDPASGAVAGQPQAGRVWRPAVDPTGRKAVYWTGTLRATETPGFAPDAGRLVLGAWDATAAPAASGSPDPSAAAASATPLASDQAAARKETTIAAGRMEDWDARWDHDGSHLAVWIADPQNPAVGRLSLYGVDPFDGRIDLKTPLLDAQLATAGFAISEGKLVWAEPGLDGSATGGRIQVLAWTDNGSGQVESVAGPVIVIR
jgi:anti-sigma factor RsiW